MNCGDKSEEATALTSEALTLSSPEPVRRWHGVPILQSAWVGWQSRELLRDAQRRARRRSPPFDQDDANGHEDS